MLVSLLMMLLVPLLLALVLMLLPLSLLLSRPLLAPTLLLLLHSLLAAHRSHNGLHIHLRLISHPAARQCVAAGQHSQHGTARTTQQQQVSAVRTGKCMSS